MPGHNLGQQLIELRYGKPIREVLIDVLNRNHGSQNLTAQELGVTPLTVRRWRNQYGITMTRVVVTPEQREPVEASA